MPHHAALPDDVERWLADEPVKAAHEPLSIRASRWTSRHRTAVTAACSTVVVAIGALGAAYRHEMSVNARLARANSDLVESNARANNRQGLSLTAVSMKPSRPSRTITPV